LFTITVGALGAAGAGAAGGEYAYVSELCPSVTVCESRGRGAGAASIGGGVVSTAITSLSEAVAARVAATGAAQDAVDTSASRTIVRTPSSWIAKASGSINSFDSLRYATGDSSPCLPVASQNIVPGVFFSEEAKAKVAEAVRAVEAKSSAEIVVAVRARSDDYRDVDLMAGLAAAMVTLIVLIFHPAELDEDWMPIETFAAFAIASIIVAKIPALKRALVPAKRKHERVSSVARAQFVDAGVSRTRDRSGILVFFSELERRVCVLPDIGIDPAKLGEAWQKSVEAIESAASADDLEAFAAAVTSLGPVLASKYPRREDDENELPDAPMVVAS
jgi:putative membrane protein